MTAEAPNQLNQQLTKRALLTEMGRVAPLGQMSLRPDTLNRLRSLTSSLLDIAGDEGLRERERFLAVAKRGISLQEENIADAVSGRTILITGGNGLMGTTLIQDLSPFNPGRIVSVGQGAMPRGISGVEHHEIEVRNTDHIREVIGSVKPQIIYHLAAQRDPSLAEKEMALTLTTNIIGTRNVLEAAREHDVPQVVYASTGKAMRPFTYDTYAFTKIVGEWLMGHYAGLGEGKFSGVRYTHIVDNSIIYDRIKRWIADDSPIRLHNPDAPFYLQSARESAQLLLNATAEAQPGQYTVQSIRNLEWPMSSLDLAMGELIVQGSETPIYISGYEEGYEAVPYPHLYDPFAAGDVSPLISSFEAPQVTPSVTAPEVDIFPAVQTEDPSLITQLRSLEQLSLQSVSNDQLRQAMEAFSWSLLEAQASKLPRTTLARVAKLAERDGDLPPEHAKTNQIVFDALAK